MSINRPCDLAALNGLSHLDDPLRRQFYEYVIESNGPVSREQAAAAASIGRTLAAYHLDKLAEAGLLTVSYQRPAGRGGPGAGRPAKLYTRAAREISVSVPPRDYELLARLLVASVEQDASGAVQQAVNSTAHEAGLRAGAETGGNVSAPCATAATCPTPTTMAASIYGIAHFIWSLQTTETWCAG